MTILDNQYLPDWAVGSPAPRRVVPVQPGRRRPAAGPNTGRPRVAPLRHRGTGIGVSAAAHSRTRPAAAVSGPVTVALAALAGLITLWLGVLGQAGSERAAAPAGLPERLAVVQVQAGETLQQLAGRMAPGTPAEVVAARIRDLNGLASSAVEAGQTLISPIG